MKRFRISYFFFALAVALAVLAVLMLFHRPATKTSSLTYITSQHMSTSELVTLEENLPSSTLLENSNIPRVSMLQEQKPILVKPDSGGFADSSEHLVSQIAKSLEAGDLVKTQRLMGKCGSTSESVLALNEFLAAPLRLRQTDGIREVGELEVNAHSRWVLQFDSEEPNFRWISLDLRREKQRWFVDEITFSSIVGGPNFISSTSDSLAISDAFIHAILTQDFELARTFVNPATVTDAKIAGLCILFEEGRYCLRKSRPLRALLQRVDTAGFLVYLDANPSKSSTAFALTLKKMTSPPTKWLVTEINLDQLLTDYARQSAGGDVYYSPIVKNPNGGDTLALYFEFDEAGINPRTKRQLEIITRILQADPNKKINLSGHTDGLGSAAYNDALSFRRADSVRNYLADAGVSQRQLVTIAKGSSQPRRPNMTETGNDNPNGRRANRRTEIYLDFE